jgi:hypothetical protein
MGYFAPGVFTVSSHAQFARKLLDSFGWRRVANICRSINIDNFSLLTMHFWLDIKNFMKDVVVIDRPPAMMTGVEVCQQIDGLVVNLGGFVGYGEQHMWTHKSALTRLPYCDDLLLPHNIDVMHTQKNITEKIWATIMDIPDKSKDNIKARVYLSAFCETKPRDEAA